MTLPIEIKLYDETIGYIRAEAHQKTSFAFTEAFLARDRQPVLGQRFLDAPYKAVTSKKGHLPAFFANLIPESDGALARLIARQHGISESDEPALLSILGLDLPGAVEARPAVGLLDESRTARESVADIAVDEGEQKVRFSLGGVQLKFSMALDGDKLTLPVSGGNWILKIPSRDLDGLSENEWTTMEWARSVDFDVPKCRLISRDQINGISANILPKNATLFAIQRYDRVGESKVHQEDFAQVIGLLPRHKYDHATYDAMAKFSKSLLGSAGCIEFLKRLVFVIASGNADAHLKNWSLLYKNPYDASWSPLYDQVAVVAWPEYARNLALKLGRNKAFSTIQTEHLYALGESAGLTNAQVSRTVLETLQRLRDSWQTNRTHWPMQEEHQRAIEEHWRRVPLLRDFAELA